MDEVSPYLNKLDFKRGYYGGKPPKSDGLMHPTRIHLTEAERLRDPDYAAAVEAGSMGQPPAMSHGRSLRAYKKSPSIRANGIMSIVDSHGGSESFAGFGGFDDLAGGGGGGRGPGTPFDKFQKMGPRGYRHTGLTPDVGLLGIAPFGSPQGKSPMPLGGANHYFPTGLTPSDGTPLSEIGHIYTNGSVSPSYSPSIFFLLANADGSPRMQGPGDRLPICSNCNATVFGSNCRCSVIGAGLSAIKAENEELHEAMHKSALLTKRKLEGDEDAEDVELDESFATDSPSESSVDGSSMSARFVAQGSQLLKILKLRS